MPLVRKPKGQTPAPASESGAAGSATSAASQVPAGSAVPAAPAAESPDFPRNLASSSADERWTAARAAADVPGSATALAAALRTETDSRVREAMFTSLARIGTPESADQLLWLLRSDSANLRTAALDSLRMMIGGMPELLPRLLSDGDVDIRILSCELARTLPGPEAAALLCDLLAREPEVNVCAAAVDVLSEVGGPAALPALAECAQRFRDAPFLGFAIKVATDRIHAQSARPRG